MAALWFSLIVSLLIQAVVPASWFDNRFSIQGVLIIIAIVLIFATVYIADMSTRDIDLYALSITDRNVVIY